MRLVPGFVWAGHKLSTYSLASSCSLFSSSSLSCWATWLIRADEDNDKHKQWNVNEESHLKNLEMEFLVFSCFKHKYAGAWSLWWFMIIASPALCLSSMGETFWGKWALFGNPRKRARMHAQTVQCLSPSRTQWVWVYGALKCHYVQKPTQMPLFVPFCTGNRKCWFTPNICPHGEQTKWWLVHRDRG